MNPEAAPNAERRDHAEGELILRFVPDLPADERRAQIALLGGELLGDADARGHYRVRLQPGQSVTEALAAYRANPAIEHVQPNYVYRAQQAAPDDPLFEQQWALENRGQTIDDASFPTNNPPSAAVHDIEALGAWELISDCRDVTVAVLDSGVNYTHEDLAANMWTGLANHGRDFVDDDDDPAPADPEEHHGTHIAGIIGAVADNGRGIAGICHGASLMAVRVMDESGSATTSAIVAGLEFAIEQGASIVTLSAAQPEPDQALSEAIDLAGEADVLVVTAAGNQSASLGTDETDTRRFPCSFTHDNLLCVAALDQGFELPDFSNRGATAVDIAAPGTNIVSSWGGRLVEVALDDEDDWSLGGDWSIDDSCSRADGNAALVNPSNWCGSLSSFPGNIDERAWRAVSFGPALVAELVFESSWRLAEPDRLRVAARPGEGDPFADGETLLELSGTGSGTQRVDLASVCAGHEDCTIGFQLDSGPGRPRSGFRFGAGIWNLRIRTIRESSDVYDNVFGTSMAAAHAAGVAALVRTFNPDFDAVDTRDALAEGGRELMVLEQTTRTGRALEADGALRWIDPPSAPVAEQDR